MMDDSFVSLPRGPGIGSLADGECPAVLTRIAIGGIAGDCRGHSFLVCVSIAILEFSGRSVNVTADTAGGAQLCKTADSWRLFLAFRMMWSLPSTGFGYDQTNKNCVPAGCRVPAGCLAGSRQSTRHATRFKCSAISAALFCTEPVDRLWDGQSHVKLAWSLAKGVRFRAASPDHLRNAYRSPTKRCVAQPRRSPYTKAVSP